MSEITIEQVKALLANYGESETLGEKHSARVALDGVRIARLCLSLDAQLRQGREAREAAESWIPVHDMVRNELHDLLADLWYEFTIPNSTGGRDAREYAVLVRTEEVLRSAGVLDAEGRYIRAALARPAQEQLDRVTVRAVLKHVLSAEALAAENKRLRAALGGIEAEAIVQYMSAANQGPAAETIVRIARAALVNAELPGGQK